jgi:hypothetical protein
MVYQSIDMLAIILVVLISFIAYPLSTLMATNYTTDSASLSINDSIRNLTNPILKIEPNPLENLSNPLAHPLTNLNE